MQSRLRSALSCLGTCLAIGAAEAAPTDVAWHDITTWGVEGRLWEDEERLAWFDRFPAAAERTVPEKVWELSRDSAGMAVRFATDAPRIFIRMRLTDPVLAMPHMPATGVRPRPLRPRPRRPLAVGGGVEARKAGVRG